MHRLYENEELTIFWNSEKCRHARACVANSPRVFNINYKPWINIGAAPNPEIWQTVHKCPSGALTCTYNHGVQIGFEESGMRSIATAEGREIGECCYRAGEEGWVIIHTGVDPEFAHKGIAKRLVYKVLEEGERRRVVLRATCSYAARILAGDP